jgi:hypothetical protein
MSPERARKRLAFLLLWKKVAEIRMKGREGSYGNFDALALASTGEWALLMPNRDRFRLLVCCYGWIS